MNVGAMMTVSIINLSSGGPEYIPDGPDYWWIPPLMVAGFLLATAALVAILL